MLICTAALPYNFVWNQNQLNERIYKYILKINFKNKMNVHILNASVLLLRGKKSDDDICKKKNNIQYKIQINHLLK